MLAYSMDKPECQICSYSTWPEWIRLLRTLMPFFAQLMHESAELRIEDHLLYAIHVIYEMTTLKRGGVFNVCGN